MAKTTTERKVYIKIPRVRRDQPDEVIWVNNKRYQIRVGEKVQVPESVATALEDREYMRQKAYAFEQANLLKDPV